MQSYPATKTLNTTGQYFIIPVDTKCNVMNFSLQVDATNTSTTLVYNIEYTLWPVEQANYPTYNTSETILNSQAQWLPWQMSETASDIFNLVMPVKGLRVTVATAGTGDKIILHYVQQGVR